VLLRKFPGKLRPQPAIGPPSSNLIDCLMTNPKQLGKFRPTPWINEDRSHLGWSQTLLVQRSTIRRAGNLHLLLKLGVVVNAPAKAAALTAQPVRSQTGAVSPVVRRNNFSECVSAIVSHSSAE
jgi:hypothetical protein